MKSVSNRRPPSTNKHSRSNVGIDARSATDAGFRVTAAEPHHRIEGGTMKKTLWRRYIFSAVWIPTTAFFGWQLLKRERAFDSPYMWLNILLLLICTVALLWWMSRPLNAGTSDGVRTKWDRFILLVALVACVLFALRTAVGPPLLFGLPMVAVAVLIPLRSKITRKETLYALGLSLIAGGGRSRRRVGLFSSPRLVNFASFTCIDRSLGRVGYPPAHRGSGTGHRT
jgi:hypothetical protein